MADILTTIVRRKAEEVEEAKQRISLETLKDRIHHLPPVRSMRKALAASSTGVIAEFKRKSPSKGWMNPEARVEDVVAAYSANGAAALSVLTDKDFFGGSEEDLSTARSIVSLPILRKDFIIDAYQIYETRAMGADAMLLIAAALSPEQCRTFAKLAHEVGLEVILEIHRPEELAAYSENVDIVGVNNRNLGSFSTDPQQSQRLFDLLPKGALPIAESGLKTPETACLMRRAGYRGLLVGEAFMATSDPGNALKDYIGRLNDLMNTSERI